MVDKQLRRSGDLVNFPFLDSIDYCRSLLPADYDQCIQTVLLPLILRGIINQEGKGQSLSE